MQYWQFIELKKQIMRLRFATIIFAESRTKWLKKHDIFAYMGDNVHFQPRFYPTDAKHIKIHNNVTIARNVNFIGHDIIMHTLNHLPGNNFKFLQYWGCIEIMDNVSIGAGAQICPNVRIGPNVIVGAGAIVTKDVPPGVVVGGVPAKVIGSFDEFVKKRKEESEKYRGLNREQKLEFVWNAFYEERENFNGNQH